MLVRALLRMGSGTSQSSLWLKPLLRHSRQLSRAKTGQETNTSSLLVCLKSQKGCCTMNEMLRRELDLERRTITSLRNKPSPRRGEARNYNERSQAN
eukprot:6692767-Pyramimonas_sp.AAC.2